MKRSEFLKQILALSLLTSAEGSLLPRQSSSKKILIVYLTRTNNTKAIAEIIHAEVGGDLISLELVNPYPTDYKQIVEQVSSENETGHLPSLKSKVHNFDQYDTIFVGYPTWGMQLPPPMKSFLSSYDFNAKTIVPFNTNAGYGLGNSVETIEKLSKSSMVSKPIEIQGGKERDGIIFVMEGEKEKQAQAEIKKLLLSIEVSK